MYKKIKSNIYFLVSSFIGAFVTPVWCILIIDKKPNLIIFIVTLLIFQISIVYIFSYKMFNYKIISAVFILSAIYFLIISSCYFGKFYLSCKLITLQDIYQEKISAIENSTYSLRLKILYYQPFYFCVGFKYFFSFPDCSYTNYAFIFQFILGKLFDVIIFSSIGNYIINKFKNINK